MSIRDHYAEAGIDVSDLTDVQLEAIGLDLLAEFGEIPPLDDEVRAVVQRHREKPADAVPEYKPPITIHALLDFEAEDLPVWDKIPELKKRFGISPTRYTQLLMRSLDQPEAMLYAPMLVARLTRIRDKRRRSRTGWEPRVSA